MEWNVNHETHYKVSSIALSSCKEAYNSFPAVLFCCLFFIAKQIMQRQAATEAKTIPTMIQSSARIVLIVLVTDCSPSCNEASEESEESESDDAVVSISDGVSTNVMLVPKSTNFKFVGVCSGLLTGKSIKYEIITSSNKLPTSMVTR